MAISQSTLLGAAGEHYVMCQLLRRGMIAALAPIGVPNADIIVSDSLGDRLCALQVKTRRDKGSDGGWHMKMKHEKIISPSLFYCFLDFGKSLDAIPLCFIVPSRVVAVALAEYHLAWRSSPGKKGQERKETEMRRFLPNYDKMGVKIGRGLGWLDQYRGGWSLIEDVSNSRP